MRRLANRRVWLGRGSASETRSDIQLLFTDVGLPGDMNGRQLADARPGVACFSGHLPFG